MDEATRQRFLAIEERIRENSDRIGRIEIAAWGLLVGMLMAAGTAVLSLLRAQT